MAAPLAVDATPQPPSGAPARTCAPSSHVPSASSLLAWAIGYGLALGLVDLAISAFVIQHGSLFRQTHVNLASAWMPLATGVAYLLVFALPLLLASQLAPRQLTRFRVHFAFLACTLFALLSAFKIQLIAKYLLTLGMSYRLARWRTREQSRGQRSCELERSLSRRQVLLGSTLLLGGSFTACLARQRWLRQQRYAALPPPPPGNPPNVLLIVLDTLRASSMSLHGYARPTTPGLDQLADQGVQFQRAIAPCSWTLPSHVSMFTGFFPHKTRVGHNLAFDGRYPTLAEVLARHGYLTAAFCGNDHFLAPVFGLQRGFVDYHCQRSDLGNLLRSTNFGDRLITHAHFGARHHLARNTAPEITQAFLDWHAHREADRPYFAFLNYYDVHDPYVPPTSHAQAFHPGQPELVIPDLFIPYSDAEFDQFRTGYDRCILGLDQQIASLLATLKAQNALQNTLVIITSDHGEHLGEHGFVLHGYDLYIDLLHVPLLMLLPGQLPAKTNVPQAVSLADLPATIAALLALPGQPFPGTSLALSWEQPAAANPQPALSVLGQPGHRIPNKYPVVHGPLYSLVWQHYHYLWTNHGCELYDLDTDPDELHNRIHEGKLANLVQRFQDAAQSHGLRR